METIFDKYVGTKINKLTIKSISEEKSHHKTYFICECECGSVRRVNASKLVRGVVKGCQQCKNLKEENANWSGYKELYGKYLSEIQASCRRRKGAKAECSITLQYLYEIFIKQGGVCALSGVPIKISKDSYSNKESTASIDRIDSSKGYIEGNIQWVHKNINRLKTDFNQELFIKMCCKVAIYRGNLTKK